MKFVEPYENYQGKWLTTNSNIFYLVKYLNIGTEFVAWQAVVLGKGYYSKLQLFKSDKSKHWHEPTEEDMKNVFRTIFVNGERKF
jgi:hypothetical protein